MSTNESVESSTSEANCVADEAPETVPSVELTELAHEFNTLVRAQEQHECTPLAPIEFPTGLDDARALVADNLKDAVSEFVGQHRVLESCRRTARGFITVHRDVGGPRPRDLELGLIGESGDAVAQRIADNIPSSALRRIHGIREGARFGRSKDRWLPVQPGKTIEGWITDSLVRSLAKSAQREIDRLTVHAGDLPPVARADEDPLALWESPATERVARPSGAERLEAAIGGLWLGHRLDEKAAQSPDLGVRRDARETTATHRSRVRAASLELMNLLSVAIASSLAIDTDQLPSSLCRGDTRDDETEHRRFIDQLLSQAIRATDARVHDNNVRRAKADILFYVRSELSSIEATLATTGPADLPESMLDLIEFLVESLLCEEVLRVGDLLFEPLGESVAAPRRAARIAWAAAVRSQVDRRMLADLDASSTRRVALLRPIARYLDRMRPRMSVVEDMHVSRPELSTAVLVHMAWAATLKQDLEAGTEALPEVTDKEI